MKKTFKILVEIEVSDLSRAARREAAAESDMKPSELPGCSEVDEHFIREAVENALEGEDAHGTIWGGSMLWAKITAVKATVQGNGDGA